MPIAGPGGGLTFWQRASHIFAFWKLFLRKAPPGHARTSVAGAPSGGPLPQGGAKEKNRREGRTSCRSRKRTSGTTRQAQAESRGFGRNRASKPPGGAVPQAFCKGWTPWCAGAKQKPRPRRRGNFYTTWAFGAVYRPAGVPWCAPAQKPGRTASFGTLKDRKLSGRRAAHRLARAHCALYPLLERNQNINALIRQGKAADRPGPRPWGEGLLYFWAGGGAAVFSAAARVGGVCDPGVRAGAVRVHGERGAELQLHPGSGSGRPSGGLCGERQVFDSAKAEVAQRIKPVEGEEVEWSITPSYTLAVSDLHWTKTRWRTRFCRPRAARSCRDGAVCERPAGGGDHGRGEAGAGDRGDQGAIRGPGQREPAVEFNKDVRVDEGDFT